MRWDLYIFKELEADMVFCASERARLCQSQQALVRERTWGVVCSIVLLDAIRACLMYSRVDYNA